MTREEAIALFEKQLTAAQVVLDSGFGSNPGENDFLYRRRKDMAEIALAALRPVSREQVKRALAMMWFAYVNSDKETPHSYETDALEEAESILGPWAECMPKYLKRGPEEG